MVKLFSKVPQPAVRVRVIRQCGSFEASLQTPRSMTLNGKSPFGTPPIEAPYWPLDDTELRQPILFCKDPDEIPKIDGKQPFQAKLRFVGGRDEIVNVEFI